MLIPGKEKKFGHEISHKKDAQYFESVIIGTGFSGLLAAIGLQKKNLIISSC
jgi:hypothetical protein